MPFIGLWLKQRKSISKIDLLNEESRAYLMCLHPSPHLHSRLQIFEYSSSKHGFDLIKPMETYYLTNQIFDIEYSNI